ncbi:MAG: prepilin-type N-terminal cleavage/methylation domain-containing protein [Oscillospiraceae bacterium]
MKKSKKFKGMTLVECIVALAVLSVFTTGMVTATIGLSKMKVDTDNIIKKNSYQAQMVDNQLDYIAGAHDDMFNTADSIITITFETKPKQFTTTKHTAKSRVEQSDGSFTYETKADDNRNFQYFSGIAVKP